MNTADRVGVINCTVGSITIATAHRAHEVRKTHFVSLWDRRHTSRPVERNKSDLELSTIAITV